MPASDPGSGGGTSGTQEFRFENLNLEIPDDSSIGLSYEATLGTTLAEIQSIRVSLNLSSLDSSTPIFNGDMYVTLRHGSGYGVLLNRVGRRDESPLGYGDTGVTVTFDDAATADVHLYRTTLTGDDWLPLASATPGASLTGSWQPDGRGADPEAVLSTSARTDMLSSFAGLPASGEWTLFIADLSPGGLAQLDSWSVEITAVPEVMEMSAVAAGVLAGFVVARRRRIRAGR